MLISNIIVLYIFCLFAEVVSSNSLFATAKSFSDLLTSASLVPASEKVILCPFFGIDNVDAKNIKESVFSSKNIPGYNLLLAPISCVERDFSNQIMDSSLMIGCLTPHLIFGDSVEILNCIVGVLTNNLRIGKKTPLFFIVVGDNVGEENKIQKRIQSILEEAWSLARTRIYHYDANFKLISNYLDAKLFFLSKSSPTDSIVEATRSLIESSLVNAVDADLFRKNLENSESAKALKSISTTLPEKGGNPSEYDCFKDSFGAAAGGDVFFDLHNLVATFSSEIKIRIDVLIKANRNEIPITSAEISSAVEEVISKTIKTVISENLLAKYKALCKCN